MHLPTKFYTSSEECGEGNGERGVGGQGKKGRREEWERGGGEGGWILIGKKEQLLLSPFISYNNLEAHILDLSVS